MSTGTHGNNRPYLEQKSVYWLKTIVVTLGPVYALKSLMFSKMPVIIFATNYGYHTVLRCYLLLTNKSVGFSVDPFLQRGQPRL